MAEDKAEGLSAAVDYMLAKTGIPQGGRDALRAMGAEQLALLPSEVVIEDARATDDQAQRRGPGRPAGSRNRSTNDWVDFIAVRYRSPLLFLAEAYTRPTAQLAAELGCAPKEAFAVQIKAATELAPYMHQKQPVAVEVNASGEVTLVLAPLAAAVPAVKPGLVIEHEENQVVSGADPAELDAGQLDGSGK